MSRAARMQLMSTSRAMPAVVEEPEPEPEPEPDVEDVPANRFAEAFDIDEARGRTVVGSALLEYGVDSRTRRPVVLRFFSTVESVRGRTGVPPPTRWDTALEDVL